MTFETRRAKALELLQSTGMSRSNYEPPLLRALWKIGINVPPPHFVPFWKVTLFTTLWFGGVWGGFMWLTVWLRQGMAISAALGIAGATGICFGMFMSFYFAYGRRKHRLPAWSSID